MMILFASLALASQPQGLKLLTGEDLKATVVGSRLSYGGSEGDEDFAPGGQHTAYRRVPVSGTYVVAWDEVCITRPGSRVCWRLLRDREGGYVVNFALPGAQRALERVSITRPR